MDEQAEDGESQPDFQALAEEAHQLGIHYTGTDAVELGGFVAMAKAKRGRAHPVPCFGLSYDPTTRLCRICQLRNPCADMDKKPRVEMVQVPLQPIACAACGRGMLDVEAIDQETGHIRDYLCNQPGCQNSVAVQCGWETVGGRVVRDIVLGEPAEPKAEKPIKLKVVKDEPKTVSAPDTAEAVIVGRAANVPVTPRRVVVKRATKPAPKPETKLKVPAAKVPAAKVPAAKPAPAPGPVGKVQFVMGAQVFDSLNAVITSITGYKEPGFFGVKAGEVRAGVKLTRTYKDKTYEVEVRAI